MTRIFFLLIFLWAFTVNAQPVDPADGGFEIAEVLVFENDILRPLTVGLKPVNQAYEIYEVAKMAEEAIEYSSTPFPDTRLRNVKSLRVNSKNILFYSPSNAAELILEIARIAGDALRMKDIPFYLETSTFNDVNIYSSQTVRGYDLVSKFRVRRGLFDVPGGLGKKLHLILDNFELNDHDFKTNTTGFKPFHQYYVIVYVNIEGFPIPPIEIKWSEFSGSGFIPLDLQEYVPYAQDIMNAEISVLAEIKESFLFQGKKSKETSLAIFEYSSDALVTPPNAPILNSESKYSSIEISFDQDPSAEGVKFYRSTNSNTYGDLINLDCNLSTCRDYSVDAGKRYYYSARSFKGTSLSPASIVVSGKATSKHKFDSIIFDQEITAYSERKITGQLSPVDSNDPVSLFNIPIRLSIPSLGQEYPVVYTDQNGEFEIPFTAPTRLGTYNFRVLATIGKNVLENRSQFKVIEADDEGRDLAVNFTNFNSTTLDTSQSLIGQIGVHNYGTVNENDGRLIFEFFTQNGAKAKETTVNFSATVGQSKVIPINIPLTELQKYGAGTYQVKVTVTNSARLDEVPVNDVKYEDLYIYNSVFNSPTYETNKIEFDSLGHTVPTDIGNITLINIDSDKVYFDIRSGIPVTIDRGLAGNNYWESDNRTNLIVPISSSIGSSSVDAYIGASTSSNLFSKSLYPAVRGETSEILINSPDGTEISAADVDFVFNNSSKLEDFRSASSDKNASDGSGDLMLNIKPDVSNQIERVEGWLSVNHNNKKYYKNVAIDLKPFHSLSVLRDAGVISDDDKLLDEEGNEIFVKGMPLYFYGFLDNEGEFFEDVTIYSEITNLETGYKHTKSIEKTIAPNSSELYRIDWNTINLWTGRYNYKVLFIHNNVPNKANFVAYEPINLVFPQEFDLDVSLTKPTYEVGENIEIRATATRLQKSIEDVIVTANIEKPDGSTEELLFQYDDSSEQYEAQLRANIGGNYYIDAHGERKYYFSDSESELGQVIVEVSPQIDSTKNRLYEYETVDLHMGPVGGLQGFATNVNLSNSNFALEDVLLHEIWNNPNKQLTNKGNSSVLGITNLGDENRINAYSGSSIASLALKSKGVGESALSLSNTSFIDHKGNPIATRVTNDVTLRSEEQKAILSLNSPHNSIIKGKNDTLSVGIINAYKVFGTDLSIGFDPGKIEVMDVIEGSYINDYGTHQSLLVKSIDNDNGLINFGLTRSNTKDEVDERTGLLANIVYRAKEAGEVDFNYNKNLVFTSFEGENLPAITSNHSIEILSLPDSLKGLITLKRLTSEIDNTNELEIGFLSKNIENISTFATDLIYDSSLLEFKGLKRGSYFDENSSLLYENKPDSGFVTLGISNLNTSSVFDGDIDTMMVATFKFKDTGEANFALNNTGVFDDYGENIEFNSTDPLSIDYASLVSVNQVTPELKFSPEFTFSNDQNVVTLSIGIDSVSNLNSFAGDINYDPSVLTFQNISEGDFFNEKGSAQTSLVTYDDSQNGILTIGLSRLGETQGISSDSNRIIANITFTQVGEDSTEVSFSNTGLLLPDGESEIDHETNKARVGRLGDGFAVTPQIISPTNSTVSAGEITFSWKDHISNDEYKVEISDTSSYSNVQVDTILSQNSFTKELINSDKYYWRVKSKNNYGESDWVTASFTTEIEISGPVTLSLPDDASQNVNLTPYFEWTSAENAQTYNFQLSKNEAFTDLIHEFSNIEETNYSIVDSLEFFQTYYWRVQAGNYGVVGPWSEVWEFTTIVEAPEDVVLASPMSNAEMISVTPDLLWNTANRAAQYQVQVSSGSDFSDLRLDSLVTDTLVTLPHALENESSYYWRVKAINEGGESDWSSTRSFTTIAAQPDAIILQSPADDTTGVSLVPVFSWGATENADTYTVEIARDTEFSEVVVSQSNLNEPSFELSDSLPYDSQYYWRVRGVNGGVEGDWSAIWSFVTIVEAPDQVVLSQPADEETLVPVTPVLSWFKASRAENYNIELSDTPDFESTVFDAVLTDTTVSIQAPLENEKLYYWRVKASNDGGESSWSTTSSFETFPDVANIVQLNSPSNGTQNASLIIQFDWNESEGADEYNLQLSRNSNFSDLIIDSTFISTTNFTMADSLTFDATYYWRVRAKNEAGYTSWSEVWEFTTIVEAPEGVVLASPVANAEMISVTPELKWKTAGRATQYQVQVSSVSAFSDLRLDSLVTDTLVTLLEALENESSYYWRVKAINEGGESDWSSTRLFTTIAAQPGVIALETPPDDTSGVSLVPVFGWGAAENADTYTVEIARDTEFSEVVVSQSNIERTSFELTDSLAYSSRHYWRVKAVNGGVEGDWSVTWSFVTIVEAPDEVVLFKPVDEETLVPITPVLSWNEATRAENYIVELSEVSDFESVVFDTVLTDTTVSVQSPLEHKKWYYWRVKATNDGGESSWSTSSSFETIIAVPEVVELLKPSDADSSVSIETNFVWKSSDRAKNYSFELFEDKNFKESVTDSVLADTTIDLDNALKNEMKYYWRVKAINEGGESEYSTVSNFKTLPAPPNVVELISPINESTLDTLSPEFSWEFNERADNYLFQLSQDSLFNEFTVDSVLSDTVFVLVDTLNLDLNYFWRVQASNVGGTSDWSDTWKFSINIITSNELDKLIPEDFVLYQNYPNPFNPSTNIRFGMPNTGNARIEVYNILGRKVYDTGTRKFNAGYHTLKVDFSSNASGVYLYRLITDEAHFIKKMLFLK